MFFFPFNSRLPINNQHHPECDDIFFQLISIPNLTCLFQHSHLITAGSVITQSSIINGFQIRIDLILFYFRLFRSTLQKMFSIGHPCLLSEFVWTYVNYNVVSSVWKNYVHFPFQMISISISNS